MATSRPGTGLLMAAAALAAPATSGADSWALPKTFRVESSSGAYRLTVVPSFGARRTPVAKDAEGRPIRPMALGTLERRDDEGRYTTVWEHPLTNDVSPVGALVADDGSVVTLDNWHSMGYGPNVVVIYAPDGTLVRSLGLEEVVPPGLRTHLSHSVSSIWWRRGQRLDERRGHLILEVGSSPPPRGGDARPAKVVRVRLGTGEIVPEATKGEKEGGAADEKDAAPKPT